MLHEDSGEMAEYIQQALKQTVHEATVLLYSPGIDLFLEDLAKGADRVFYFEEGPRDTSRLTAKAWLKMKDQKTLEGVLIIWSRKHWWGARVARDVVNPRMLELETAKEILAELFDIRTHEVDAMIRQRMEERTLYGQEFNL
jgi:hypothetical protein